MNLTDTLIDLESKNLPIPDDLIVDLTQRLFGMCHFDRTEYKLRHLQLLAALQYIRKGRNLFCVLPTGYGKTLIAVLCALYEWFEHQKRTIFIGLYKALTAEQFATFTDYGIPTIIDDGDHRDTSGAYETEDWAIGCFTPEKFDAILCNDIRHDILMQDVGLIVTDEVQNIADEGRGHRMENYIMICRARHPELRYVYLSATIANPEEIASWTDTILILGKPEDRPVPLHIVSHPYKEIFYSWSDSIPDQRANMQLRCQMLSEIMMCDKNANFLIFVTSKQRAEQVVQYLCEVQHKISLSDAVEGFGFAWHTADLSMEDRAYVEAGFRSGSIKAIACTPTLAAGVNLPADHAIIFDVEQFSELTGSEVIKANRIQQSMGRAGRPGLSKAGFADLIMPERLQSEIIYKAKHPDPIKSQFAHRLHEKILQWIAGGICENESDCIEIMQYSLAKLNSFNAIAGISWLKAFELITENDGILKPTEIGKMTNYMYVMPETVVYWMSQIDNVINCDDLRELFIRFGSAPEFYHIVRVTKDDAQIVKAGQSILGRIFPRTIPNGGEQCIYCSHKFECQDKAPKKALCSKYSNGALAMIPAEIHKAYFLTFYDDLAEKYLPKKKNDKGKMETRHLPFSFGDRMRLKGHGSRMFSAAATIFFRKKEVAENLQLLASMCEAGTIQAELVDLCKLEQIGITRARKLIDAGIKSIGEFRAADPKDLAIALGVSERVARNIQQMNE